MPGPPSSPDEWPGDSDPPDSPWDVTAEMTGPVSRSVFDEPTVAGPAADVAYDEVWEDESIGPDTLDGAAFGIYEDDDRRRRMPLVVAAVILLFAGAVGALVYRAVNTDAELTASPTTTSPADPSTPAPTMDLARSLVPEGVETCVAPETGGSELPIVLECPIEGVPESLSLELYGSDGDRDARVDALAADLEFSGRDDAECALGRQGRHGYVAAGHGGEVMCREVGGRVDFVWTRDDAPVVLHASGGGRYSEYAQAWDALAGRTDADFPMAEERELLDVLPDAYLVDCARDLTLVLEAGGTVAAACRPSDEEPAIVSWVRFADGSSMDDWIVERKDSLDENVFDTTEDGCTPQGFGQRGTTVETSDPDDPDSGEDPDAESEEDDEGEQSDETVPVGPAPDAAFTDYGFDGSSGQVLCFVNTSGQNVVFWTRNGEGIGSIAVSDKATGATMAELLAWWRNGGHRP